jgi:hypothetical protein
MFSYLKVEKGLIMLDLLPIQWDDDAAIAERESREEAVALLKDMLGEKYLLHPSNMVERQGYRSAIEDALYGQDS